MRTVPISSGLNTRRIDQATHSGSSCSPIQVRFIQVVTLAIDPPNCVICSAVDVLTPADVIGSPLQLKENILHIFSSSGSTDHVESSSVQWDPQAFQGLEYGQLKREEETTVHRHNVGRIVDADKRQGVSRIEGFSFPDGELFHSSFEVVYDIILVPFRDLGPDSFSHIIQSNKLSEVFRSRQSTWTA